MLYNAKLAQVFARDFADGTYVLEQMTAECRQSAWMNQMGKPSMAIARSRAFRAWFVASLLTPCVAVIALTLWLSWPACHRYWTARKLVNALKSEDRLAANKTGAAIEENQGYDAYIVAFSDVIRDGEEDVSKRAIEVLCERIGKNVTIGPAHLGRDAKSELITALVDKLKDRDVRIRRLATGIVGASGLESNAAPLLVARLGDEDSGVRRLAAEFLGEIGPDAREGVASLVKSLQDEDKEVRATAAAALGQIGPESKLVIPALIEALHDRHNDVRALAAGALGRIGPRAKTAAPALLNAVNDEHPRVRQAARNSLKAIDPHEAARLSDE